MFHDLCVCRLEEPCVYIWLEWFCIYLYIYFEGPRHLFVKETPRVICIDIDLFFICILVCAILFKDFCVYLSRGNPVSYVLILTFFLYVYWSVRFCSRTSAFTCRGETPCHMDWYWLFFLYGLHAYSWDLCGRIPAFMGVFFEVYIGLCDCNWNALYVASEEKKNPAFLWTILKSLYWCAIIFLEWPLRSWNDRCVWYNLEVL